MGLATPLTPPPFEALVLHDGRKVRIGRPLGRGSMATVYRGVIEGTYGMHRPVAVKLFGIVATDDQESALGAIARAAQRMACVRHPNVAQVYELGITEVQPYIASELVDGMSLRQLLDAYSARGRKLPLDLALFIALEIAEGLCGARLARDAAGLQMGMVHGELSAREVLMSWFGEVKLTDFELSGARQASSSVRKLSQLARRADTMAPEIACGMPGDARSDVFSLGILLREMLIGPRFAKGMNDADALGHAREGYVQETWLQPHLPEDISRAIHRALAPEPAERYPHAAALAYDIRRVALSLGVGDGRVFLRSALQAEREDRSDVTAEHTGPGGHTQPITSRPPSRRSTPVAPPSLAPLTPFSEPLGPLDDDTDAYELFEALPDDDDDV